MQLRGDYTGTDITQIAAGLIFSERQARVSADGALSTSIDTVSAVAAGKNRIFRQTTAPVSPQLNDIWVDTSISYVDASYFDADYSVPKYKQFQWDGSAWIDITDQDIRDNFAVVTQEIITRASADEALATQITTVATAVDQNTAAIISETTARTTADTALATDITNLESTVNTNNSTLTAAIQTEATTRADADTALATDITTLTSTVNTNNSTVTSAIQTEATTRASADTALASSITTLQTTVDTNTTSIQTNQQSIDGVKGLYSVRIDNNGFLSGFGLISEFTQDPPLAPTSTFLVNVDKFAVAIPPSALSNWQTLTAFAVNRVVAIPGNTDKMLVCKVAGTSGISTPSISGAIGSLVVDAGVTWQIASRVPFYVLTNTTTINGQSIAPGVYIDGASIVNATIGNAQIANAAIDDAKIANLSAAKITAGSISVNEYVQSSNYIAGDQGWRINGNGNVEFSNAVVRGTVFATDGRFVGEVIAEDDIGNKARMFSGDFEIYKNVPNVGQVLYKTLSRVESGIASNNVVVTIPGYFINQPKIIVSPANLQLYSSQFSNQNQSVQCEAIEITQTSAVSMVWTFRPKATLNLADATGQTTINQTSGVIETGWTSSQYTTPANTTSITPTISLASNRGTGTSGVYYKRSVRWRVQYLSGETFISGSYTTIQLSSSVNASITSAVPFVFPSANAWVFRIQTEAFDTDGTTFGSTEFETATDNISRSGAVTVSVGSFESATKTLNYTPTYSLPSGWTFVSATYNYNYNYAITFSGFNAPSAGISGSGLFINGGSGTNLTRTYTNDTANSLTFSVTAGFNEFFQSTSSASLTLNSVTGTVLRRRPATSSTTANNQFSFIAYDFSLTTAQVLATGTLNWIAIGE